MHSLSTPARLQVIIPFEALQEEAAAAAHMDLEHDDASPTASPAQGPGMCGDAAGAQQQQQQQQQQAAPARAESAQLCTPVESLGAAARGGYLLARTSVPHRQPHAHAATTTSGSGDASGGPSRRRMSWTNSSAGTGMLAAASGGGPWPALLPLPGAQTPPDALAAAVPVPLGVAAAVLPATLPHPSSPPLLAWPVQQNGVVAGAPVPVTPVVLPCPHPETGEPQVGLVLDPCGALTQGMQLQPPSFNATTSTTTATTATAMPPHHAASGGEDTSSSRPSLWASLGVAPQQLNWSTSPGAQAQAGGPAAADSLAAAQRRARRSSVGGLPPVPPSPRGASSASGTHLMMSGGNRSFGAHAAGAVVGAARPGSGSSHVSVSVSTGPVAGAPASVGPSEQSGTSTTHPQLLLQPQPGSGSFTAATNAGSGPRGPPLATASAPVGGAGAVPHHQGVASSVSDSHAGAAAAATAAEGGLDGGPAAARQHTQQQQQQQQQALPRQMVAAGSSSHHRAPSHTRHGSLHR